MGVASDTVEWDQLQRVMTCVNQPERSLPCGSVSSLRRGRDDYVTTPTPCSEQQGLCKEHTRHPGAMLRSLFHVFQPRQVLFWIRAQSAEKAVAALGAWNKTLIFIFRKETRISQLEISLNGMTVIPCHIAPVIHFRPKRWFLSFSRSRTPLRSR